MNTKKLHRASKLTLNPQLASEFNRAKEINYALSNKHISGNLLSPLSLINEANPRYYHFFEHPKNYITKHKKLLNKMVTLVALTKDPIFKKRNIIKFKTLASFPTFSKKPNSHFSKKVLKNKKNKKSTKLLKVAPF